MVLTPFTDNIGNIKARMKNFTPFTLCLLYSGIVQADIITDGSLGQAHHLTLNNAEYAITQDLGTTAGNNLFHSFQNFNVGLGETATFSGASHIENVFSRVTGGTVSSIHGTIKNTISHANTYLMNPVGIVFGEGAQLDVQGSFYATTASYLGSSEQAFFSHLEENSQFNISPPTSFGFLGDATIQIKDTYLSVLPTKTLSFSAGHIELQSSHFPSYDDSSTPTFAHALSAPSGQVYLQAENTINLDNFAVDTSGLFGGTINIHAQQLHLHDSQISSHTVGDIDGQVIDIQVDELQLIDSDIVANTYAAGRGTDIYLHIKETLSATREDRPLGVEFNINANGSSHIRTMTAGQSEQMGDSGDIHIQARNIDLTQAAEVRTRSYSAGKAGDIEVQVTERFQAENALLPLKNPNVVPVIGGAHTFSLDTGNSGNVSVQAQQIVLNNGGQISANTLNAQGGNVTVQADNILLKNQHALGFPTAIGSASLGIGQAGQIDVQAKNMTLDNGGVVTATTFLSGEANQVSVVVEETLRISGVAQQPMRALGLPALPYPSNISSSSSSTIANSGTASDLYVQAKDIILEGGGTIASLTYGGGDGGNATVVADTMSMSGWENNGLLYRSGINNASSNPAPYAGQAGSIDVTARYLHISDGAAINTSAASAGGGNIHVQVSEQLHIVQQGQMTTSVQSGVNNGGNIQIESPQFTVLNQGLIVAQADAGRGGNIQLTSHNVLNSTDSLISASSRLGLDGNVDINSPDLNFSNTVLSISDEFIVPTEMQRCTVEDVLNGSRFLLRRREAVPPRIDDIQALGTRLSTQ